MQRDELSQQGSLASLAAKLIKLQTFLGPQFSQTKAFGVRPAWKRSKWIDGYHQQMHYIGHVIALLCRVAIGKHLVIQASLER